MISHVYREMIPTNSDGEAIIHFDLMGRIEEINVDYGTCEQDTLVSFRTSSGHTFDVMGNNSQNFPINPRHTPNTRGMTHLAEPTLEKYVNAGFFTVKFSNTGPDKVVHFVEIIYSD